MRPSALSLYICVYISNWTKKMLLVSNDTHLKRIPDIPPPPATLPATETLSWSGDIARQICYMVALLARVTCLDPRRTYQSDQSECTCS